MVMWIRYNRIDIVFPNGQHNLLTTSQQLLIKRFLEELLSGVTFTTQFGQNGFIIDNIENLEVRDHQEEFKSIYLPIRAFLSAIIRQSIYNMWGRNASFAYWQMDGRKHP